jgi:quinolinate synthase
MGENLVSLLDAVLESGWSDDRIRTEMHPEHDRSTLRMLRDNIVVYPNGNCVVHHMFGSSVVDAVIRDYPDAYVTAHLEVPGEMFQIALRRSHDDMGVVGSTSNILNFIERKVREAASDAAAAHAGGTGTTATTGRRRLRFILGTEAGMVTSIVGSVQDILESSGCRDVEAEIVFPVSSEAVMGVDDDGHDDVASNTNASSTAALGVVPGSAGGEGCSAAGGCATCPFMKMNDLDAVHDIVEMIGRQRSSSSSSSSSSSNASNNARDELRLAEHLPPNRLSGKYINGRDAIELGTEPIIYMREFMKGRVLSDELVERVEGASGMSPR